MVNDAQLDALEGLVDELLKNSPEEVKIQTFMRQAGLIDPKNHTDRVQAVLDALRFEDRKLEME
jgi:hypothetical protein